MKCKSHINWVGSKFYIAKWIIENMPEHKVYVEPFGGGCHVLAQKEPVDLEIYNDINGDVVNLFKVLQSEINSEKLIRLLDLTPYSRELFYELRDNKYLPEIDNEEVKQAYKFCVMMKMSFGGKILNTTPSFGYDKKKIYMPMLFLISPIN